MRIQGEHTFDAPRELVWRALLDPEVLARTLPGCERLEKTGENEYRGVLNVQVGPVKGQFQGTLQLSDLVPLESYHMKLDGSGSSGFMNGEGELRLADAPGGTLLVGQRLLESSAKSITRQGLEGLGRELAAMKTAEPSAPPAPPPVQPSQAEIAARVAGDVARDLVPVERRPWLIGGAVVVGLVIVLLLIRACGS
jgi:uncharacterized protein